ncbi:RNase A-like domain-containing protein [Streptomyces sp. NPDC050145]|uniref:RNase A-like domain-containing protein n=1 Tax=Streptomyces sp. NPDC050145 TaxID=3365602 RepID=UPI0037A02014
MAGPTPAQPQGGGTIDVKPSTLHQVAGGFSGQQTSFDKGAKDLLTALKEYPDAGGYGTAARAFATEYVKVGNRFTEVWAKSVASVGGAAVGFATTANNYSKAEAANDPSGQTRAQIQPPPVVIDKPPKYEPVPDLQWGDDDGGDDFIRSILEWIPDVAWHVIRPLLEQVFRWGKVAEVYPFPQQHYLNSLSQAWSDVTKPLGMTMGTLDGLVSGITQQSNSEWYDAMRQFCSSLWGSTAWGKSTAGYEWKHDSGSSQTATHPAMAVLHDSAMKVSDLLRDYAEAAVELNGKVWDIYFKAVKQALGDVDLSDGVDLKDLKEGAKGVGRFIKGVVTGGAEVAAETTLNIDTPALNAVVEAYNRRMDALTPQLTALLAPLDEAFHSAPKYAAEQARAEAFGARALNDFKHEHKWTNPEDSKNHVYRVDLASDEWLDGGHTLDKHVGKTDLQLAQRLRDQGDPPTPSWPHGKPSIGGASTFPTIERAQELTQYNVDQNTTKIKDWLADPNRDSKLPLSVDAPNGEDSGRSVTKQPNNVNNEGFKNKGLDAKAIPVKGVRTILKYDPSLDPPFVVLTSMPAQS